MYVKRAGSLEQRQLPAVDALEDKYTNLKTIHSWPPYWRSRRWCAPGRHVDVQKNRGQLRISLHSKGATECPPTLCEQATDFVRMELPAIFSPLKKALWIQSLQPSQI